MAINIQDVLDLYDGRAVSNIENLELRVAEIVRLEDLTVRGNASHMTLVSCGEDQLRRVLRSATQEFLALLKECILLVGVEDLDAVDWLEEHSYIAGPLLLEWDVDRLLRMVITESFAREDRLVTSAMRRITQVARTGGIQGVLSELSRFVDGWAVVLDAHGQVIQSVGAARLHIDDAISVVMNRPVRVRYPDLQVHLVGSDANGEQSARLVVASRSSSAYRTRAVAAHAADLLAFMIRVTNVSEVEQFGRELMIETLVGNPDLAEEYLKRWKINDSFLNAFVISSRTRNIDVHRLVSLWLEQLGIRPLYSGNSAEVFGFIPPAAAGEFVNAVENFRTNRGEHVTLGLAEETAISRLGTGMKQAREAHAVAVRLRKTAVRFSELLTIRPGLVSLSEDQLSNFSRLLDPLKLSGDDPSVMINTLRVFLAHHGSWKPAASELGVHRQTLMNRMERAEAALGMNLASADDRAILWFALRANDM